MKNKLLAFSVTVLLVFTVFTGCQLENLYLQNADTASEKAADAYCLNPEVEAEFMSNAARASTPYMKLFEHANYSGGYYFVYSSDGNVSNFGSSYPAINDQVSSILVYNGARAKLFQHANYGGVYMFVFESVANLTIYGYNDMFSSLSWYTSSYYSNFVLLYEHAKYRGRSVVVFSSLYNLASYGLNDEVSSIRFYGTIRRKIRVYEHAGYAGFYMDFTGSYPNLSNTSFNDRISSAQIFVC
jgi:hypothetical protein